MARFIPKDPFSRPALLEIFGYMPPYFEDFFLLFFFAGIYFFHPIETLPMLLKMPPYWKWSMSILEEVGVTEDPLR